MIQQAYPLVTMLLWSVTMLMSVRMYSRLRGSTLVGPWAWIVAACGLLILREIAAVMTWDPSWQRLIHFTAVGAAVCPVVALFGAKRPQAWAWQFIVLSLVGILILPAIEVHLRGTLEPDIQGLRAAFMWLLPLCGLANYVATRFAIVATIATVGQCLLVWTVTHHLTDQHVDRWLFLAALWSCLAACLLGWLVAAVPRSSVRNQETPLQRQWFSFRNAYGAVWALRVAQRVNRMAQERGLRGALDWWTAEGEAAFEREVISLLRSFLSPDAIAPEKTTEEPISSTEHHDPQPVE